MKRRKEFSNRTKNISRILLFLLTIAVGFLIMLYPVNAEIPKITPYVNDFAELLNDEQEANLNILCDKIEQETNWEIAIVTVKNTEGDDRTHYANLIGDNNGVGKKGEDNGIVVLWSVEDNGGAIATGRYSESIINDAKAGRIGRESREKYFDNGLYYEGFDFIVKQLYKEISGSNTLDINGKNLTIDTMNDDPIKTIGGLLTFFISLGIIFVVIAIIDHNFLDGVIFGSVVSDTVSSSSGGGSFSSGGSFSGGGFGGGGSSF